MASSRAGGASLEEPALSRSKLLVAPEAARSLTGPPLLLPTASRSWDMPSSSQTQALQVRCPPASSAWRHRLWCHPGPVSPLPLPQLSQVWAFLLAPSSSVLLPSAPTNIRWLRAISPPRHCGGLHAELERLGVPPFLCPHSLGTCYLPSTSGHWGCHSLLELVLWQRVRATQQRPRTVGQKYISTLEKAEEQAGLQPQMKWPGRSQGRREPPQPGPSGTISFYLLFWYQGLKPEVLSH